MWVDERRRVPAEGKKEKQKELSASSEQDIYDQVSALVEELEAARGRALAAGGQLPRAVEAAASALEPLLRLRDVTGAACDLMPWLPQLLSVFKNVLRTAVDGQSTNCSRDPLNAAMAAAAAISALQEPGELQHRIRAQDSELKSAKQREQQLLLKLEEMRRERDELCKELSKQGGNCLARRVVDLERERSEWTSEWRSVEVRVSELLGIVSAALEDKPVRRE